MSHNGSTELFDLTEIKDMRPVLAASTGGHLSQLVRYSRMVDFSHEPLWITFDHPQSRSLLAGKRVEYVPYIAPRDLRRVCAAIPLVRRLLRSESPDIVISTGAALATAVLPLAPLVNARSVYIESVSRFDGPSLSGRILGLFPRVERYAQHSTWAGSQWPRVPSVLNSYVSNPRTTLMAERSLKVFVTLGTIKPYKFDSLIDKLQTVLIPTDEVFIQSGVTDVSHTSWDAEAVIAGDRVASLIDWADVVVTHAGVGSAMQIMDRGKAPVLAIRRARRGEHIDDHQSQIAQFLTESGLAKGGEVESISRSDLLSAAAAEISSK